MKTITINVSEPVYEHFRRASRSLGRPTSELIREAMEHYRREHLHPATDLMAFRPRSAGKVLRRLERGDDLLHEMIDPESGS
jgi:predicted DNA-binding protein